MTSSAPEQGRMPTAITADQASRRLNVLPPTKLGSGTWAIPHSWQTEPGASASWSWATAMARKREPPVSRGVAVVAGSAKSEAVTLLVAGVSGAPNSAPVPAVCTEVAKDALSFRIRSQMPKATIIA